MSLISMTGFGAAQAASGGLTCTVEIGTVNRKQLDIRITLPRGLGGLESRIQEEVRRGVSRGQASVQIAVGLGASAKRMEGVDLALAEVYVRDLRLAAERLGLKDDLSASTLLGLPGVVRPVVEMAPDAATLWPVLRRALRAALTALTAMRRAEGLKLEVELRKRLKGLRTLNARIRKLAPLFPNQYREQLRQRLGEALGTPIRDEHLLREVAILAERCDVTEEMVRLDSHFGQFDTLLDSAQPVGRALDFLCQEMLREINTTGSKCGDARVSADVVRFKAELEIVREQVQNVE